MRYLERVDPTVARLARRAYGCFDPYHHDEQRYAAATALVPTSCEDEAVTMLQALRAKAPQYREDGRDAYFHPSITADRPKLWIARDIMGISRHEVAESRK